MAWDPATVQRIWEKGITEDSKDPDNWRKDAAGGWMQRNQHGNRNSEFGWEIDHVFPQEKAEKNGYGAEIFDHDDNLRPFNWKNNASKKCEYPEYSSRSEGRSDSYVNDEVNGRKVVNEEQQGLVTKLFGKKMESQNCEDD